MRPSTRMILTYYVDDARRRLENLRHQREQLLQELGKLQDEILDATRTVGALEADLADA